MKKLLLILLLSIPLFCLAQTAPHTVTTTDGKTYSGEIESYLGKKVVFTRTIPELGKKSIPVENIAKIEGYIKNNRKNAIQRGNPAIVFFDQALDNQQETIGTASYKNTAPPIGTTYTAGDYVYTAGQRYLTGMGVSLAGAVCVGVGAGVEENALVYIGGGAMLAGFIISITGHIQLKKAGTKMNSDAITLTGAKSGLGLAVNF